MKDLDHPLLKFLLRQSAFDNLDSDGELKSF